jgi:hypothetical protein
MACRFANPFCFLGLQGVGWKGDASPATYAQCDHVALVCTLACGTRVKPLFHVHAGLVAKSRVLRSMNRQEEVPWSVHTLLMYAHGTY